MNATAEMKYDDQSEHEYDQTMGTTSMDNYATMKDNTTTKCQDKHYLLISY